MARIFEAKNSFIWTEEDGSPHLVPTGYKVREGHPVLKGRESFFRVFDGDAVDMEHEAHEPKPERRGPGRPRKDS
jgi:hypothetical protein